MTLHKERKLSNDGLTVHWVNKTLTKEILLEHATRFANRNYYPIRHDCKYFNDNGTPLSMPLERHHTPILKNDINHFVNMIYKLYMWQTRQQAYIGKFLGAIIDNNLSKSIDYADSYNKRMIGLYVKYLYNCAPSDWRTQISEDE